MVFNRKLSNQKLGFRTMIHTPVKLMDQEATLELKWWNLPLEPAKSSTFHGIIYYESRTAMHLKPIFHCDAKTLAWVLALAWTPNANFALGIPTGWYLKTLKFALLLTRNPNGSQWNIGCVGSPGIGPRVGHVHFMFFVLISFALGRRKPSFQWNIGLTRLVL